MTQCNKTMCRPTHTQLADSQPRYTNNSVGKECFSINGAAPIGYPYGKKKNNSSTSQHTLKSISDKL